MGNTYSSEPETIPENMEEPTALAPPGLPISHEVAEQLFKPGGYEFAPGKKLSKFLVEVDYPEIPKSGEIGEDYELGVVHRGQLFEYTQDDTQDNPAGYVSIFTTYPPRYDREHIAVRSSIAFRRCQLSAATTGEGDRLDPKSPPISPIQPLSQEGQMSESSKVGARSGHASDRPLAPIQPRRHAVLQMVETRHPPSHEFKIRSNRCTQWPNVAMLLFKYTPGVICAKEAVPEEAMHDVEAAMKDALRLQFKCNVIPDRSDTLNAIWNQEAGTITYWDLVMSFGKEGTDARKALDGDELEAEIEELVAQCDIVSQY
ncbi:hypothetical protein KVT40_003744 [Elsinoe batatas]|uniref:Uncharacterized protein n=1 Tax=Elsinoe batatas TaxID=2601811 RepID=A0A8K0PFH5_9PEZI|nr:hypothetical protein KVT40_003744 [Elsinoe batatas]